VGNIFSLQDRITKQIVAALEVQLTADDERRFAAKETTSKEAYDAFLHGWQHYLTRTPEDLKKAVEYFKKAIEIDPDYGRAYAALALTYWRGAGYGWARKMGMSSYNEARIRAVNVMEMAMKKPTSIAHRLAADMLIHKRRYEEAIAEAERALVLDPNDSENYLVMGRVLRDLGRPEVAINYFKRAMLLNPLDKAFSLGGLGLAQFCMGQFEDTVAACEEGLKNRPEATAIASGLAAAYGQLGREQEARAALEIYKMGWGRISPHLPKVMYFFPFKNPKHAELFANGLLNAGLPGKPSGYFKVSDERRLKGEEIKSLFFGKKMVGHAGKRQWRIERAQDGEAKFWYGSKFLGSGKSWVEGDDLCNQWEKVFGGVKYCMDAYRNPEGTPEQKNDYFLITDYGMFGCSPEDLEG
jgi:tetratricopeptide (TPR) repeat protein